MKIPPKPIKTRAIKNAIKRLFKKGEKDLSYIANNPDLLQKHIRFICAMPYVNSPRHTFVVPDGINKGKTQKTFAFFREHYTWIYERWLHLLKCCFDPNYLYYKFFGAKGVSMSLDFLNSRTFCTWCLMNGLTSKRDMYSTYLQRRNKNGNFSPYNCYVVTEKELHECKDLKIVLDRLYITKRYEEEHDPSVSYLTMYTRYYLYDMSLDDALHYKYDPSTRGTCAKTIGFSPSKFYASVATENDVPWSMFISRIHHSYLNGGFIARPYDMLRPEYSIEEETAKQGKISYKKQWDRNRKEKENKLKNSLDNSNSLTDDKSSVYSNSPNINVYSED